MPLRPYVIVAAVLAVVGAAENIFFGADKGGARHIVSVGFFFLLVIALVALVVLAVVALTRRMRGRALN